VAPDALSDMGTSAVPQYLDLAATLSTDGPRFTVPSALVSALWAALEPYGDSVCRRARYDHYAGMGRAVRPVLESLGMPPLVDGTDASPHVVTFRPPPGRSAEDVLEACREWGFTLGGQSGYLRERGWLQLSAMGAVGLDHCKRLFEQLTDWLGQNG
jgi:aspartate aminotransferase-like enzyme